MSYLASFIIYFFCITLFLIGIYFSKKKKFRYIGIFLYTISLFPLAVEAYCVLFPLGAKEKTMGTRYQRGSGYLSGYIKYVNGIGIVLTPGKFTAVKEYLNGDLIYSVLYTIGPNHFRITPQNKEKKEQKVHFMGGSFTFGEGVNDNETLPFYFSRQMPSARVFNHGIHGMGAHQVYILYKELIKERNKTIVYQTIPWHADRSACLPNYQYGSPKFQQVNGDIKQVGFCDHREHEKIKKYLEENFVSGASLYEIYKSYVRYHGIKLYIELIKQMNRIAKERNQRFIVAFIKAKNDWFPFRLYNNERIMRELKSVGVSVLDITLAVNAEELEKKYSIEGDGHPTQLAHEKRAKMIATFILKD